VSYRVLLDTSSLMYRAFYSIPPTVTDERGQPVNAVHGYLDMTARLFPRVTLYTSYRINQDNGQGNRLADPTGNPGTLISSYPMSYQSPEGRLAIKLNRHFDWNLGYQYYNYNESKFPGSPRPQNYHAHLPYMSLRVYLGRGE